MTRGEKGVVAALGKSNAKHLAKFDQRRLKILVCLEDNETTLFLGAQNLKCLGLKS